MRRTAEILLVVILLTGCFGSGAHDDAPQGVQDARTGVAAIVAHTDSAEANVARAVPFTRPAGQPYLEMASDEHAQVITATGEVSTALDVAQTDAVAERVRADEAEAALVKFQGKWWVRWGMKAEQWFWRITIGWFIFCIVAVAAQLGNPVAITVRIIKFIVGMIPFTYIASLLGKIVRKHRDWR